MAQRHRVEVALPLPVPTTFTYLAEDEPPAPGTRVLVPFRRRERIGWVVGPGSSEAPLRLRSILDVLEDKPSAPPEILALASWMASYYLTPLGMVLRTCLPSVLSDSSRDFLSPAVSLAGGAQMESCTPRERKVLLAVARGSGPRRVSSLRKALGMGTLWPEIRRLKGKGLIRHQTLPPRPPPVRTQRIVRLEEWISDLAAREEIFSRAPRQRELYEFLESSGGSVELAHLLDAGGYSRSVVKGLEEKGIAVVLDQEVMRDPFVNQAPAEVVRHTPTADQARVLEALTTMSTEPRPKPTLIHGVTGSGKTLIYIELLREVVARQGRGAIVLVPEIALTPQTVSRFRAHFGDEVAVLHSALSDGERFDAWRQLRRGEKRIAVGARSAVFAPVRDLGVIVVDEEHDGSYKQSEGPRYQGRDVAVVRATMAGALCVLGSATPSLESWQNARSGKFLLHSLPRRVGGGQLPPVKVVDLKTVWREGAESGAAPARLPGHGVLSPELVSGIQGRLERGEQVMLLLNRRGYSNFVQCRECGEVWRCPHCSVSLTFHRVTGRLLCHYCHHEESAPGRCPRCGSDHLAFRGLGTEQVERVVAETFSGARIARMDVDTTSGKWSHHQILSRFDRGEIDILLGTQMISKGLDFPRVTLVGVVNADVGIHLPDFRASERTFQLLSQVAGRAGRGTLGGEVVIQTSLPGHYAVEAALKHDYRAFAERELRERMSPPYPPHVRLANVVVSSPSEETAARECERCAAWVRRAMGRKTGEIELVGPAPAPIERLHGRWRWHFLVRSRSAGRIGEILESFQSRHRPRGGDVRVIVDRDPVALL